MNLNNGWIESPLLQCFNDLVLKSADSYVINLFTWVKKKSKAFTCNWKWSMNSQTWCALRAVGIRIWKFSYFGFIYTILKMFDQLEVSCRLSSSMNLPSSAIPSTCNHQGDRRLFLLNFIQYKTMRYRSGERHHSGNKKLPWPVLAICRSARLEFKQWLVSERVDPSWSIWVNPNEICCERFPSSFG